MTTSFGSTSSSKSVSLRLILQKHEEQLIDNTQNICLLCKRKFLDNDKLELHKSLSELHSSRLKKLKRRLFSDEQLDRLERKEREALYRDRAKERRLKYGDSDKIVKIGNPYADNRKRHKGSSDSASTSETKTSEISLGRDNKGAALLSKMGWREGTGLGKSNQGMTQAIQLQARVGTSGLGSKTYKVDPNASYKDAVRQVMLQRYQELSSEDEDP